MKIYRVYYQRWSENDIGERTDGPKIFDSDWNKKADAEKLVEDYRKDTDYDTFGTSAWVEEIDKP